MANAGWHFGDLLALILLIGWAIFLVIRIHYGFDLTDEGLYLSATDRLARGDLPFRDEQTNGLRQFDVLMSWIWRPFGGLDLVTSRCLGAALQLGQMVALWAVIRRWSGGTRAGAWIAAITGVLIPCSPMYAIWSPGYNDLSCSALVIAACCLARGGAADSARGAVVWAAGAGLGLALCWISYCPSLATIVVPCAMTAWGWWRGSLRHRWVTAGATCLAVAVLLVAVYATGILAAGLGPAWLNVTRDLISLQNDATPLAGRIANSLALLIPPGERLLVLVALFVAIRVVALKAAASAFGMAAGAGLLAACAYTLFFVYRTWATFHDRGEWFGANEWVLELWLGLLVFGLAAALVFLFPRAFRDAWRGRPDGYAMAGVAILMVLAYGTVQSIASTNLSLNLLHIRGALAALGAAAIATFIAERGIAIARPMAFCGTVGMAAFAVLAGAGVWQLSYRDVPPAACTATFAHAPLTGIRSTPERVAAIESLQTWTQAHVPAGARIIAYHESPGIYYLTRTLPSLGWPWTSPLWTRHNLGRNDAFMALQITDMATRNRQPAACVRLLADPFVLRDGLPWPYVYRIDDPLHAYVCAHFRPAWRHWPFEISLPADTVPAARVIGDLGSPTTRDPSVDIVIAPDTTITAAADGTLIVDTAAAPETPVLQMLEYGSHEESLRCNVEGSGPIGIELVQGDVHRPLAQDPGDHFGPGWDATFPDGEARERGFALVLAPPENPPAAHHRLLIRHLTLAILAGPP